MEFEEIVVSASADHPEPSVSNKHIVGRNVKSDNTFYVIQYVFYYYFYQFLKTIHQYISASWFHSWLMVAFFFCYIV
jgi:hypothetical protein